MKKAFVTGQKTKISPQQKNNKVIKPLKEKGFFLLSLKKLYNQKPEISSGRSRIWL